MCRDKHGWKGEVLVEKSRQQRLLKTSTFFLASQLLQFMFSIYTVHIENVVGWYNALELEHPAPPTHQFCDEGNYCLSCWEQELYNVHRSTLHHPILSQRRQKQLPAFLPSAVKAVNFYHVYTLHTYCVSQE